MKWIEKARYMKYIQQSHRVQSRGLSLRHRRPIFVWEVKIWMSETLPDTPRPLNFLKIDVNSTYKHLLEHP